LRHLFAAWLWVLLLPEPANAQSSLTAELTDRGKIDLSFDFLGSVARRQAGGFEWCLPAVAFGATDRLEVGAALSVTAPSSQDDPRELLSYARWKWLDAGGRTAVVGGAWRVPVSNRVEPDAYGVVTATFSQEFGTERPAILTVGGYALVGRRTPGDTRRGVTLGWDQAISSRWSWSIEWTSGDNWYGYASSGVTFSTASQWVTAGYCVGNQSTANHGPCLSFGRTF
jgi:hypothetical protein